MRIRTTAAAVLVAAAGTVGLAGVAQAGTDLRDCEDFSSQRQAQAVLDSPAGDPQRLDADGDGLACEIWFANQGEAPEETGAEETGPEKTSPEKTGADETGPDETGADGTGADESSTGPARQVSPVPRGGVDTGLDTARPVRSSPGPPLILAVAAFTVAGTAAAGAAAAALRVAA
jgi:hypothetical protein